MFFRIHKQQKTNSRSPHNKNISNQYQKKIITKNDKNMEKEGELQLKNMRKKIQDKYYRSKLKYYQYNQNCKQSEDSDYQVWSKLKNVHQIQLKSYHQQEQDKKNIIFNKHKNIFINRLSTHINQKSTQYTKNKSSSPHNRIKPAFLLSKVQLKDFQTLSSQVKIPNDSKIVQNNKRNKINSHRTLTIDSDASTPHKRNYPNKLNAFLKNR